jgi:hypothetical protein
MGSCEMRRQFRTAAGILVLGAVSASALAQSAAAQSALESGASALAQSASAQSAFEPVANDERQARVVDRIRDEQSRNGPYAAALIEPLTTLAFLYQEDGDRALSDAAFEQARQVVRANFGLYSLEETPLIRQRMLSEEAQGDAESAWYLEQDMLDIVRRHPTDPRSVPILRETADRRMDVLRRYRDGHEFPPQIVLGCYYGGAHSCRAGSRGRVIRSLRAEARRYYRRAIDVLVRTEGYASDELRELVLEGLSTGDYYRDNFVGLVFHGILAHDLETSVSSPSSQTRVDALIDLADWSVVLANRFDGAIARDAVLQQYRAAYQTLASAGAAPASIDELFAPETPVVLPTFLPNPLASTSTRESARYIDVGFDITWYGAAEDVEVLAAENASRAAERDLVRMIERRRFRPQASDGRFPDAVRVSARYYLDESRAGPD